MLAKFTSAGHRRFDGRGRTYRERLVVRLLAVDDGFTHGALALGFCVWHGRRWGVTVCLFAVSGPILDFGCFKCRTSSVASIQGMESRKEVEDTDGRRNFS